MSGVLKLSTSNSSSSLLTTLEHDVNISATDKLACFKLLRVVIKNLCDPIKCNDIKFRQLRPANPKLQAMFQYPSIVSYLQQIIGFEEAIENGEAILRINNVPDTAVMSREYIQISAIYERIEKLVPSTTSTAPSSSTKPVLKTSTSTVSTESTASSTTSTTMSLDGLSEKQKARILKEQKEAAEKEAAKMARKRTVAQIQADKVVRQTDPNWKPTVSAAAAKNGSSLQTFRDKYGE
jgi:hypothetical protein